MSGSRRLPQAILDAVDELASSSKRPGDILVFLSGEREIRETAETLRKHHPPTHRDSAAVRAAVHHEQNRVFQPHAAGASCWPPTLPKPR